jgi:hypothetical protein
VLCRSLLASCRRKIPLYGSKHKRPMRSSSMMPENTMTVFRTRETRRRCHLTMRRSSLRWLSRQKRRPGNRFRPSWILPSPCVIMHRKPVASAVEAWHRERRKAL